MSPVKTLGPMIVIEFASIDMNPIRPTARARQLSKSFDDQFSR
jgi:hypothetical protein